MNSTTRRLITHQCAAARSVIVIAFAALAVVHFEDAVLGYSRRGWKAITSSAIGTAQALDEISQYSLTEWYADDENAGAVCRSDFMPVNGAAPALNGSGETCYFNPFSLKSESDQKHLHGVVWFAKVPELKGTNHEDTIFLWWAAFKDNNETNLSEVMPGTCDENGICECGPFNQVRAGWNDINATPILARPAFDGNPSCRYCGGG